MLAGLSLTKATYWLFIFALGVAMLPLSLIVLWLNFNDWRDDLYSIDENGEFNIQYRTWMRYRSSRRGPIASLQDAWVVQRGPLRFVFNFGDIYIQVGWSRIPFCLRDVQDPRDMVTAIKHLAEYYRNRPEEESVDAVSVMLERYD